MNGQLFSRAWAEARVNEGLDLDPEFARLAIDVLIRAELLRRFRDWRGREWLLETDLGRALTGAEREARIALAMREVGA